MHTYSLTGAWQFRQAGTQDWLPASVPGGAHTDLMALGRILDPFVGDNEKRVAWVAEADWDYQRIFGVPAAVLNCRQVWLVCDGLDTLATLTLNGQTLGRAENMFRQYRWDVKPLLRPEGNVLEIRFDSVVRFATAKQAARALAGVSQAIAGGPYVRKAPCQFGWDWGPKLPPVGIWKDIRLEGFEASRLVEVHLRQVHSGGKVSLRARAVVLDSGTNQMVSLQVTAPDGRMFTSSQALRGAKDCEPAVEIDSPQLWWPNGLGGQPLYAVQVDLMEAGTVVDSKAYQVGLRTIELRQEADKFGRSFTFVVNGQPVFAKGADWIPADSFPTRISDVQLEGLIRSAAEVHQNMLRVWGGGFYEEDRFYDLCDRYGILLWQDFIFSCSIYPLNEAEFLENVRVEVVENVRRLRHRASLALWCGNNEMEEGWVHWGWDRPENDDLKAAYDQFFHHTLPAWCEVEDPDTAYWPSSPSSNVPFENPRGQRQGDAHYWEVWHGRMPFTAYRYQFPRFMSEFGFQALPPLETIRTYAQEADWNMTSYIMEQHQRNDSGNALIVAQMLETFRLPKDFDSLVYLSMVLQAEGIRYGVEHWRRHPDRVSGTLYWQLNDCWPVASWSSLDYFGRWKALHYAARRFYAPLMLSIEDAPPRQSVYLTSDLRERWLGFLTWELTTLDGEVLTAGQAEVEMAPFGVMKLNDLDFSEYSRDETRRNLVFTAELWAGKERVALKTAYFAPTKHLELSDPAITTSVRIEAGKLLIDLRARTLARLMECSLSGVDVVFSDNYFDLPAGKTVTITVVLPAGWDAARVQAALRVRSVYNSFA